MRLRLFTLIFFLLLYQAIECHAKFVIDSECKSLQVEVLADPHRFEVRSERAVVPASDGDVLAREHARIALASGELP